MDRINTIINELQNATAPSYEDVSYAAVLFDSLSSVLLTLWIWINYYFFLVFGDSIGDVISFVVNLKKSI